MRIILRAVCSLVLSCGLFILLVYVADRHPRMVDFLVALTSSLWWFR